MKMLTVLVAVCGSLAVTAAPAATPEIPEPSTRLVLPGGPPVDGAYRAAIEIALPDGWHTYWRNPGDAGLPPIFDTSASGNLAAFEVAFPAPERWTDGFSTSIVYHDLATFPVRIVPVDPGRPVDLQVAMTFGFCREICIPEAASFSARISPDDPPAPIAAALVAAAAARVPVPEAAAPAGAPRLVSVERSGDDPATALLTLTVETADPAATDLFAEPPEGWWLTVPRKVAAADGRAVFELPLKGMPKAAEIAGAAFRFTLVAPGGAVEADRTLD